MPYRLRASPRLYATSGRPDSAKAPAGRSACRGTGGAGTGGFGPLKVPFSAISWPWTGTTPTLALNPPLLRPSDAEVVQRLPGRDCSEDRRLLSSWHPLILHLPDREPSLARGQVRSISIRTSVQSIGSRQSNRASPSPVGAFPISRNSV